MKKNKTTYTMFCDGTAVKTTTKHQKAQTWANKKDSRSYTKQTKPQ